MSNNNSNFRASNFIFTIELTLYLHMFALNYFLKFNFDTQLYFQY